MSQLVYRTVRQISFALVASLVSAASLPRTSTAQWQADGNLLCTAKGVQVRARLLSDGAGGAIVVWEDGRATLNDIYGSRFTASGMLYPGWPATGAPLCTAPGLQGGPVLTSDGGNGAIVAWSDGRSMPGRGVYAQRIGPRGQVATGWPRDGVPLCLSTGAFPVILRDEVGGAFVVWPDNRNTDHNHDIYAQRVSTTGTLAQGWAENGFGVSTSQLDAGFPAAMPDGAGGAFVVWESFVASDLFAQRITASGTVAPGWPPDGLLISGAPSDQRNAVMTSDASGGVIMAWYDARSDNGNIYAQHFTPSGRIAPGWTADGVAVCTAASDQHAPAIIGAPDGAIVVWTDYRSGTSYDIYAQRMTSRGDVAPGWPADGVPVCTAPGHQLRPLLVSDGAGGAIVAWLDQRSDAGDIYAQRIMANGAVGDGWPLNGLAVCTAVGLQGGVAIETDEVGGALVCWSDGRSGNDYALYAARVSSFGLTGPAIPRDLSPEYLQLLGVQPNPTRGHSTILFRLSSPEQVSAEVLDPAGRTVTTLATDQPFEAGRQALTWDGRNNNGSPLRPAVYVIRVAARTGSFATKVVLLR